jgi:putative nucleotidyltransferase with HDIG domain
MTRLERLRQTVKDLYGQNHPGRAEWADWLYDNHVLIVAANAKQLAEKYGANKELAEIAALLHDIADYKMKERNDAHEQESLKVARKVMTDCGYKAEEIVLVVDDAIMLHGCHDGKKPASQEGLILATADALAHLQSDFYIFFTIVVGSRMPMQEFKSYALKKLDRDFYDKISFDDEREAARPDYEVLKHLFSR